MRWSSDKHSCARCPSLIQFVIDGAVDRIEWAENIRMLCVNQKINIFMEIGIFKHRHIEMHALPMRDVVAIFYC